MRAWVFEQFGGPLELREVPDPDCPADGVVVRVEATGLCRSDWHAWSGHDDGVALPHVPGHELAGVVVEVGGKVRRHRVGDRVTTPFVLACGACEPCARGQGQVCAAQEQPGFTRWGSYAELVGLPRADVNLVALPAGLGFTEAALLGCRVATAHRAVVAVGGVREGEQVVVHGCGGVGLSAVAVAVGRGADVLAVDPAPASRALAERLGARTAVPGEVPPAAADLSLDTFGSRGTVAASLACLRPRGRHVQVGLLGGEDAGTGADLGQVVARELQVLGSHGMAAADYPGLLAEVAAGTLDVAGLVRAEVPLADAGPLLTALGRPGAGVGGMTVVLPQT